MLAWQQVPVQMPFLLGLINRSGHRPVHTRDTVTAAHVDLHGASVLTGTLLA
jgi:hypothetical protein